jgi:hypothetical protein
VEQLMQEIHEDLKNDQKMLFESQT